MKITSETAPWTQPIETANPLFFTSTVTLQNAKFLTGVLGEKFLAKAIHSRPGTRANPLLADWMNCGVGSVLGLNLLAEDLKVVTDAEGFSHVLHDLRNSKTYWSTRHTIHTAALLGRAKNQRILKFFPQTTERLPDFLVSTPYGNVACEAKALASSDVESAFNGYTEELIARAKAEIFDKQADYPCVSVVLKNPHELPAHEQIIKLVNIALERGPGTVARSALANIFIEETPPHFRKGLRNHRLFYVLAKRSDRENLRVESRGRDAAEQLAAPAVSDLPGALFLALTEMQDPNWIDLMFKARFKNGRSLGLSSVCQIRTTIDPGPPEVIPVDLVCTTRNQFAKNTMPNVAFAHIGLLAPLMHNLVAPSPSLPAYRAGFAEGTYIGGGVEMHLGFPSTSILTPSMLI